jgi:hypothetical protein
MFDCIELAVWAERRDQSILQRPPVASLRIPLGIDDAFGSGDADQKPFAKPILESDVRIVYCEPVNRSRSGSEIVSMPDVTDTVFVVDDDISVRESLVLQTARSA